MRQGQWYGTRSVRESDFEEPFVAIYLSNSGVNLWYKCLKSNAKMKNLNSLWFKDSNMVPELYVGLISQNYSWQFFFLILK